MTINVVRCKMLWQTYSTTWKKVAFRRSKVRTILIIDKSEEGLVTGDHKPYYINEKNQKIEVSSSSVVTYLTRGTQNVLALQAEIAELKARIRSLL